MVKKSSNEKILSGFIGLMTKKSDGSKWFLCRRHDKSWCGIRGNDWDPIPPPWKHTNAILGDLAVEDDLIESEDKVKRYFGSYKNAYTLDKVIHVNWKHRSSIVLECEGLDREDLNPVKIQKA